MLHKTKQGYCQKTISNIFSERWLKTFDYNMLFFKHYYNIIC